MIYPVQLHGLKDSGHCATKLVQHGVIIGAAKNRTVWKVRGIDGLVQDVSPENLTVYTVCKQPV